MFLSIDIASPGMTVVRDVVNVNGAVLLTAGTALSPEVLRRLKMWGIKGLHVEGEEAALSLGEAPPECPPALLRAAEELVNRRFRHVTESWPTVGLIREMAIQRTAERLMREAQVQPPGNP